MIVYAMQNETVDALAYRVFGKTKGIVEIIYQQNPTLCELPAMTESEAMQLEAFYRFISHRSNCKLLQAMKNNDFSTFAKLYNGPTYKKNSYDTKLKEAYESYAKSTKK